nr:hypothetical protein [Nitrosomonas nitrosa]
MAKVNPAKKSRRNVLHARDEIDNETGELVGERVEIEDPGDPKQKLAVVRVASPLRKLLHRGSITQADFESGQRFAEAYTRSMLGPRYAMTNADRIVVDVSTRNPEQMVADNMAAEEVRGAIQAMGVLGGSILECVCGQEMTIQDWVHQRARMNTWGVGVTPQGAGILLRGTLGALIEWYRQYDRGQ